MDNLEALISGTMLVALFVSLLVFLAMVIARLKK